MRKYLVTALLTSILMLAVMAGAIILLSKENNKFEDKKKESAAELGLLTDAKRQIDKEKASDLSVDGPDRNVLSYPKKSPKEIYDAAYSNSIREELEKYKKKGNYGFDASLWAKNPFGTNNLSMYLYFKTNEPTYLNYFICVDDKSIPDFTRTLANQGEANLTKEHEYQLTGFVPGMDNYIVLELFNAKGKRIKQKTYRVPMDSVDSGFPVRLAVNEGKSKGRDTLSNGLFCVFGYDTKNKELPRDILMYDNAGVLRADIPVEDYRSDRLEFIRGNLVYSYDYSSFAAVSPVGQVLKTYDLGRYVQHHDFLYNGYGQLWILVTDKQKKSKTVEDVLISLDLETGEVGKLLDFEQLLKPMKNKAKMEKGKKKLDWLHLNSITMTDTNDIVVSARELSSIIKVKDINSEIPQIEYIIAEPSIWKGTPYKKLLLKKAKLETDAGQPTGTPEVKIDSILDTGEEPEDPFVFQCGQHTVYYEEGNNLEEGQYYLGMFNNNYGGSLTRPDIKWSKLKDVGVDAMPARNSLYYKYLVDEKNKTVTLAESIRVPYSDVVSSAQSVAGHRVINSGVAQIFSEYDRAGNLLFEYRYPGTSHTYRVLKYDMKPVWYQ